MQAPSSYLSSQDTNCKNTLLAFLSWTHSNPSNCTLLPKILSARSMKYRIVFFTSCPDLFYSVALHYWIAAMFHLRIGWVSGVDKRVSVYRLYLRWVLKSLMIPRVEKCKILLLLLLFFFIYDRSKCDSSVCGTSPLEFFYVYSPFPSVLWRS